jgi:quercetin dioxygenase-like cupin family protein
MSNRSQLLCVMLAGSLLLCLPHFAPGQEAAAPPAGRNIAQMKFVRFPGLPTCVRGSVQSGDPTKGPSIILARMAAGCSVPWHWHTPNEHLMMVSGVARVEMKGGKPLTLRAGGFAQMPAHHVHRFRATTPCTLFVYSDAAFDIHYVNTQGKEISPGDALKAVRERAARPDEVDPGTVDGKEKALTSAYPPRR